VRTVFAASKAASDAAFIFSGANRPLSDFPAAPPAAIFTMRKAITMGANALNLTALIAVVGKPAFRFVMSSTSKIVHFDACRSPRRHKKINVSSANCIPLKRFRRWGS
jgi:hypothetical protein